LLSARICTCCGSLPSLSQSNRRSTVKVQGSHR
jgi:hypothetical protein